MHVRRLVWLLCGVFLAASVVVGACGDDDDDDDDDFQHANDDDAGDDDDDDDDATSGQCQDYADAFFGVDGCFPDETVHASTLALCADVAALESDEIDAFYACLAAIDCAAYDDLIQLYEQIQTCLGELPGF